MISQSQPQKTLDQPTKYNSTTWYIADRLQGLDILNCQSLGCFPDINRNDSQFLENKSPPIERKIGQRSDEPGFTQAEQIWRRIGVQNMLVWWFRRGEHDGWGHGPGRNDEQTQPNP